MTDTPKEVREMCGQHDGTFGISVINNNEGTDSFVVLSRDELRAIGDAIAKELALQ